MNNTQSVLHLYTVAFMTIATFKHLAGVSGTK